jgi:hypothetical protein
MSAPEPQVSSPAPADAVIVAADIAAGHDGLAELIVSVRYENGVIGSVVLDTESGFDLIEGCGAGGIAGLIGRSWRETIKGL